MLERLKSGEIGRASRGADIETLKAQVDRVRDGLGDLAEMLGDAAEERLAASRLLERAEAIRARAADQLSTGAQKATRAAREHPVPSGLAVLAILGLLAIILTRRR